jgi:hypothetical protein
MREKVKGHVKPLDKKFLKNIKPSSEEVVQLVKKQLKEFAMQFCLLLAMGLFANNT